MVSFPTIALLYSRACPLACADCITESSPKAVGKMDFQLATRLIDSAAGFTNLISFTGGEPLSHFDEVLQLIRRAVQNGFRTGIVTGGGWLKKKKTLVPNFRR